VYEFYFIQFLYSEEILRTSLNSTDRVSWTQRRTTAAILAVVAQTGDHEIRTKPDILFQHKV